MDNSDEFFINFEQKLSSLFGKEDIFNNHNIDLDNQFNLRFNTVEENQESNYILNHFAKHDLKSISEFAIDSKNDDSVMQFANKNAKGKLPFDASKQKYQSKKAEKDTKSHWIN